MTVHAYWREDAACLGADPDLFFPIGTIGAALRQIEEAKRICRICPARVQCLAWALDNAVADGVWGGTTEEERRRMRSLSAPKTTCKGDDDDRGYYPAERREYGMRAPAAQPQAARLLRRAGIGTGAGGTGAVATADAARGQCQQES
jgi:WhiB family transcriptional regulator, redox-sensing transcriptional regulator